MHPHTRLADLFAPAPARRPVLEALARRMPIARMMGFRKGDGTGIGAIRKGDGTGIGEVRTGDGTVLFSGDAIPDSVVDNFEDGDLSVLKDNWSGWSGDTGAYATQTTTVLEGTTSVTGTATNGTVQDIRVTRNSNNTPSEVKCLVRGLQRSGASADDIALRIETTEGALASEIALRANGDIGVNESSKTGSWSLDTTYRLRLFDYNYSSNHQDWEIVRTSDDSTIASGTDEAFVNNVSSIAQIELRVDANDAGSGDTEAVFDYVQWVS